MFQNQQRARVSTDSAARVVTSKGYRVQTVRGNILNKNLLQFHIKIFYKKKIIRLYGFDHILRVRWEEKY